jgi:hypothetical protein
VPEGTATEVGRRPWYLGPVWVVAFVVVAVPVLWSVAGSLSPVVHSPNAIERPSDEVRGADTGLHQLHGHLNHVVWHGGTFDRPAFEATATATLEDVSDAQLEDLVRRTFRAATAGDHLRAHALVEQAERRLIELAR